MKLLLINPTIEGEPEAFHLGLAAVGSYVREHSDHEVTILDFAFHRTNWERRLQARLDEFQPDLIGIYISTPFFPNARRVTREIKRLRPRIPIVAGGHHPTLSPEEVIQHDAIDMLIVGEGERPTLTLLDALVARTSLDGVPGLWWKDGGTVRKIPKGPLLPPEEIPRLDWDLYDEETRRETFYFFGLLPVMGSRGCPYKCSFCAITNVQKLYKGEDFLRFRDPICVVDEIEQNYQRYQHLGLRLIYFYDLNFLIRTDWLKAFTDEYKRRGLNKKLPWNAYTRADHINRISMECLKDSGCVGLRVGIEAANEKMRNEVYVKQLSQKKLLAAIAAIKDAKISIIGYFLTGGPGERPEYLMESLELSHDFGIEYPTFFLYKPLAGTDILDRAAEMGSIIDRESMEENADFLHGVNMKHKHISERQITSFHTLTQVIFGARLVLHQLNSERLAFLTQAAQYLARGIRHGFTPYEALVYYVFYGYDHLKAPPLFQPAKRRSLPAAVLFRGLRLWLRSKDGFDAKQEAAERAATDRRGGVSATLDLTKIGTLAAKSGRRAPDAAHQSTASAGGGSMPARDARQA